MMTGRGLVLGRGGLKDLEARYETLRQNHLDGVGGWAMSVFVREGMCGWIRAWMDHDPDAGSKRASKKDLSQKDVNEETGKDMGDLVGLIASMMLAKLKGV